MSTTPLITGEESWLDTPAGRSWKAAFAGCPEPFRWSPEQVATAILKAHEIVAAEAGRVGPSGASGGGVFRMASSGLPGPRFLPYEVTWAQSVVAWPRLYLLDEGDLGVRRAERAAISLWIKKETGERLAPGERALYRTPAHRKARKRGLVWIAAALMRARVRHPEAAEPVESAEGIPVSDDPAPVAPSPRAWHAPPDPPGDWMPTPEDVEIIVGGMLGDAAALPLDRRPVALEVLARTAAKQWASDWPSCPESWVREAKVRRAFLDAALAALREASAA